MDRMYVDKLKFWTEFRFIGIEHSHQLHCGCDKPLADGSGARGLYVYVIRVSGVSPSDLKLAGFYQTVSQSKARGAVWRVVGYEHKPIRFGRSR